MNKLVKIRLNNEEVKDENYIYLVGGIDEKVENDSCYTHGLSVFFNGEYILNFILSSDDVELLTSDMKVKCVKDLGFSVYTYGYNLEILKYVRYFDRGLNQLANRISYELKKTQVAFDTVEYDCIQFVSENRDAFAKGLKEALLYPTVGQKLYHEVPFLFDEIVEF